MHQTIYSKMEITDGFNIGKVKALRAIRKKSHELMRMCNKLSEPLLDDLSILPQLYQVYLDIFKRRGCPAKALQVYNRKKFLLIVLYLYSPGVLVGERMRFGLRDKLSELFGLTTGTPISDNCADIMFNYEKYRDFRRDVHIIFDEISAVIEL